MKKEGVHTFGKKKKAIALANVTKGSGDIRVNGVPLSLIEPAVLRPKIHEPLFLLGTEIFSRVDINIKVNGGGHVSQIYAIRQAISRGIVAFYQKFHSEAEKKEIRDIFLSYDRAILIADPRRKEPKKFGGPGARAKYQKSYR